MKKAIISTLRQSGMIRVILVVVVVVLLIAVASLNMLLHQTGAFFNLPYNYHTNLILSTLCSDTMASFSPILAVVPLAASYIEDVKSKFARFILIRTEYVTYLMSRIFACFLSGGVVIVTGTLLAWGVSALLFLPMEKAAEAPSESAALFLKTCVLLFLNGGLWAVLGMTMSTIMESKYIAYASPFIVYYILVILHERYFPNFWLLSPKNWLKLELWPYGLGSAALFLLELTFLCSLVFYIRGRRRLENL